MSDREGALYGASLEENGWVVAWGIEGTVYEGDKSSCCQAVVLYIHSYISTAIFKPVGRD